MDKLKKILKETLFPAAYTCSFCQREVFSGKPICEDCKKSLPYNNEYICDRCGRKTSAPIAYCNDCKNKEIHFDIARSVYLYKPPINYAVQNLKYNNYKFLAREFAEEMAKLYVKTFYPCDAIVFVPTSERKIKERGYNQSELVARALAKELSLPVFDDVLYKSRDTSSQVGLSQKERLINLSGSFSVKNRSKIKGKTLLLTDDVLTTGTTANLVSKRLKNAGAEAVFLLTVSSVYLSRQD